MQTKPKPKRSNGKNPYDWTKKENRDKASYKLWIAYRKDLAFVFTGSHTDNTFTYYGFYKKKDFGLQGLEDIVRQRLSAIYSYKIIDNKTNQVIKTVFPNEKAAA